MYRPTRIRVTQLRILVGDDPPVTIHGYNLGWEIDNRTGQVKIFDEDEISAVFHEWRWLIVQANELRDDT